MTPTTRPATPSKNPAATATTTAGQEQSRERLRAGLADLELDPLTEHCVTARAALDPAATGSEWLQEQATTCAAQADLARTFATAAAAEQHLDQHQTDCLAAGYAALPPDTVTALITVGATPEATNTETAQALEPFNELLDNCGATPG